MKTKERKAESEPDEEKGSEEVEDSDSVWLMLYNSIFFSFSMSSISTTSSGGVCP